MLRAITFGTILVLALAGCVKTTPYSADAKTIASEAYTVKLDPIGNAEWAYYDGFELTVENTGTKDIELNWDRTLYMENGQTNGGFMYEGIVYAQRNSPKPPDLIFAGTHIKKRIYPNVLVDLYKGYKKVEWMHRMFKAGRHGVSLSLWIDGEEIRETVEVKVTQLQTQKAPAVLAGALRASL